MPRGFRAATGAYTLPGTHGTLRRGGQHGFVPDPEDASKSVVIAKADIAQQKASPVSLMPKELVNTLNEQEVLDLIAYLLSRGNPNDPVFKK